MGYSASRARERDFQVPQGDGGSQFRFTKILPLQELDSLCGGDSVHSTFHFVIFCNSVQHTCASTSLVQTPRAGFVIEQVGSTRIWHNDG